MLLNYDDLGNTIVVQMHKIMHAVFNCLQLDLCHFLVFVFVFWST